MDSVLLVILMMVTGEKTLQARNKNFKFCTLYFIEDDLLLKKLVKIIPPLKDLL